MARALKKTELNEYGLPLAFNKSAETAQLKSRLKRGPKLSRQMRAEFALCQIGGAPRRLSPAVLAKLKAEIVRIGCNGTRQGFKFAQKMFERYPELKGA
jgi:hypothetical protein